MVFYINEKILHGRSQGVKHQANFGRSLAIFTKQPSPDVAWPEPAYEALKLACLVNCAKLFAKAHVSFDHG
jgi:hypothetical protein